jgi:hypothetical protein
VLRTAARLAAPAKRGGLTFALSHLGSVGLFSVAILDSSPPPTFGGLDILTAVLAAIMLIRGTNTLRSRQSGLCLALILHFGWHVKRGGLTSTATSAKARVPGVLKLFDRWETGALAVTTAVPFLFPPSALFAAAGASDYSTKKYVTVVALCRAARYSLVAILAERYGRHFVRVVRHTDRYWGWLLLFTAIILTVVIVGIKVNRRLESLYEPGETVGRA